MRIAAGIAGLILIATILWDVFETIILPRRVTRRIRLTSLFYTSVWLPWSFFARHFLHSRRKEKYLGLFGPLSLIILLGIWAVGLILGYALLLWSANSKLNVPEDLVSFWSYLYLSGVTFFTLGYGDISPVFPLGRTLAVIEAGNGFGLLAIVISYLPILYQAFSRREASISLLDARSGSPSSAVELLRRHRAEEKLYDLDRLLGEWERWSAELLESHLSYPVLCYFRSQHDNQSWLGSMTTILDTCALVMVGVGNTPAWQAKLTFAMARHAVVDLAQIFRTAPAGSERDYYRLLPGELERIREILAKNGTHLQDGEEAERKLAELRSMYEPYVCALSEMLLMSLPPWIVGEDAIDNWKTSAWGRIQ